MPAATPSLLEALFTARLDLNERADEIRGRADLERERVDAAIDTERMRILGYQATHPAAPVAGDLDRRGRAQRRRPPRRRRVRR